MIWRGKKKKTQQKTKRPITKYTRRWWLQYEQLYQPWQQQQQKPIVSGKVRKGKCGRNFLPDLPTPFWPSTTTLNGLDRTPMENFLSTLGSEVRCMSVTTTMRTSPVAGTKSQHTNQQLERWQTKQNQASAKKEKKVNDCKTVKTSTKGMTVVVAVVLQVGIFICR